MIFPARVGMNPTARLCTGRSYNFPRASGDEPDSQAMYGQILQFSPREWG